MLRHKCEVDRDQLVLCSHDVRKHHMDGWVYAKDANEMLQLLYLMGELDETEAWVVVLGTCLHVADTKERTYVIEVEEVKT